MASSNFITPARSWDNGAEWSFHIVLVCEDQSTTKRALELYHRLVLRLTSQFRMSRSLLHFDRFQSSDGREAGLRDVAQSDLVVLSAHGDQPLAEGPRRWLEACAANLSGRRITFVALLDHGAAQNGAPVCEFLKGLALKGGIDLFLQSDGRGDEPVTAAPRPARVDNFSTSQSRRDSFPWGLNE